VDKDPVTDLGFRAERDRHNPADSRELGLREAGVGVDELDDLGRDP
jgi:hypothetical protein